MKVFKCRLLGLCDHFGDTVRETMPISVRAKVVMYEDHDRFGSPKGGVTVTSAVRSIDFERRLIVTRNNVYDFND